MVCDFSVMQQMLSMDEFSGRGKPTVMGINIFKGLRGGHGGHGIMFNDGMSCDGNASCALGQRHFLSCCALSRSAGLRQTDPAVEHEVKMMFMQFTCASNSVGYHYFSV